MILAIFSGTNGFFQEGFPHKKHLPKYTSMYKGMLFEFLKVKFLRGAF